MQLPFDQASGGALDTGVRDLQHELGELFWWKRSHVFFLRFLEHGTNSIERIRVYQTGVHPIGHDLVESLAQSLHSLQAAFSLDWTEDFDDHRGGDFRKRRCLQIGEHVQRERSPNVLGVGGGYRVFLQLEPSGGHLLEGVLSLSKLGLPYLITLDLGINTQGKQLARLDSFFPSIG
ncbi:hypothetical protein D3C77_500450 [compost metagenome]